MLKTIFTGHTLLLESLTCISPILQECSAQGAFFGRKTMYFNIYLYNSAPIRYEFMVCETEGEMQPDQIERWDDALDKATADRAELVAEWDKVLYEMHRG